MSFDNSTKLSFFPLLALVMILPFPLLKVSLTLLLLCVTCFFLVHRKATLQDACNNGLSIGKIHAFLWYHCDESVPFGFSKYLNHFPTLHPHDLIEMFLKS